MRAHIDITEVETKTKIRAKYLRAIENEEWDLLPGPIYVKSFLKTYGECLGLDTRMLIDEYKRRYERPSDHDTHTIATLHRERERAARGPLLPPWLITGGVLVVIVAALFVVGTLGSGNNSAKTTPTTGTTTTTHHKSKHGVTTTTTTTKLPTTAPATVKLALVPTGTVYVCVENSHHIRLVPGVTYTAGQTIPTVHAEKLLVTLGNNNVTMHFNGKPYTVAASSGAIGLEVLPTGVKTLAAGQGPNC